MSCCSTPGIYNITCNQGATFSRVLTWADSAKNPYDITGYTARMHVRSSVSATSTLATLTTENGRIALGGTSGTVTLTISAIDTAALAPGLYVYDLELISAVGGVVNRIIEGNFAVKAEVTR